MPINPDTQELGGSCLISDWDTCETQSEKQTKRERVENMAQVVEYLPIK
jgi:hypothetical protein